MNVEKNNQQSFSGNLPLTRKRRAIFSKYANTTAVPQLNQSRLAISDPDGFFPTRTGG
ncbi:MAG: hypothetical protein NZM43_09650 [Saprospiraceae bacterium]|nr:hypothetical protein [Saprospiraceae bacterium]MDW8484580.1 hypothetical protein [Saprospiraceae bacterium]